MHDNDSINVKDNLVFPVEDEKFRSVAALHLGGWIFLPTPAGPKFELWNGTPGREGADGHRKCKLNFKKVSNDDAEDSLRSPTQHPQNVVEQR